jgi:hypothetical protein
METEQPERDDRVALRAADALLASELRREARSARFRHDDTPVDEAAPLSEPQVSFEGG